ncbi:MAG: cobalt ECF transporter T component CbiQ [Clostridiales bacterium]|nr:cobalt ECF transporter T component CbiQ [Clostridiales bacterium]
MIAIDKLCYGSRLRYVNASEKTAFAVVTLLVCVAGRSLLIAGIVLGTMGILTVGKGGIPFSRYVRLLLVPLGFLLLSTLAIMVNISTAPLDLFAVQVGSRYVTGSTEGMMRAVRLVATALAGVSCLYFLSLSTPVTDILTVLEKWHCPGLLIELMLLIYRFIFVLLDIAAAISTAQDSRLGNRNFKTACHSFGILGAALFVRALKKSNALYDAMEARCYDGRIRVLKEDYPPSGRIIAGIVIYEVLLVLLALGGITGWKI